MTLPILDASAEQSMLQGVWGSQHQALSDDEKRALQGALSAVRSSVRDSSLSASWRAARQAVVHVQ